MGKRSDAVKKEKVYAWGGLSFEVGEYN